MSTHGQVPAAATPAAAKPTAQPPASQIVTAAILELLAFFFVVGAVLAGGVYVRDGEDLQRAQSTYNQAERALQEAKDAGK